MSQSTYFAISQQKSRKNKQIIKSKRNIKIRFEYFLFSLVGLVIGQAELSTGLFPLALIYLGLMAETDRNLLIIVSVFTGMGLVFSGGYYNLIYFLPGVIGFVLRNISEKNSKIKFSFSLSLWISMIYLLSKGIYNYRQHVLYYKYFLLLGETVFIYILTWIGRVGVKQLFKERVYNSSFSRITVFLITISFLIGFTGFDFVHGSVLNVIIMLFVCGIAYVSGLKYSMQIAAVYGIILGGIGVIPVITVIKYLIISLSSSLFQKKKKVWMSAAALMAFLMYSRFSPTVYNLQEGFLEIVIMLLLFLVIPTIFWEKIMVFFSEKSTPAVNKSEIAFNNKIYFNQHLDELSFIFDELSRTFEEVLPETGVAGDVKDFFFIFKSKICRRCQRKSICWGMEKEDTFTKLELLLQESIKKGNVDGKILKKYLKDKCIHCEQIISSVKYSFELYQINEFWKKQLADKQIIVSRQLEGIGNIIKQFSDSLSLSGARYHSYSDIGQKALKSGLNIYKIELDSTVKSEGFDFIVEMEPCTGNCPCRSQMLKIINSAYKYNFRIIEHSCGSKVKNVPCKIVYSPRGNYCLEIAYKQLSGSNDISGDSYLYKPLSGGKDLIVLSDGMGVGEKAAKESKTAIKLLKSIINAGFDQELAIKTINSALYLRNREESFTTLDIAVFDTFTGEITFNKIGAVASYIKRDWDLLKIDSSSLPAGILDKIEISSCSKNLQPNDYVIMFTDGILDSVELGIDSDRWFKKLLKNSTFETPEEMIKYIMDVIYSNGENINDDLTIAVLKMKETAEKRRIFAAGLE